MQGSFTRKRGAKWTAYFYVVDAAGKRRQRSKGGFKTKRQAQAYLTKVVGQVQKGELVEPSKLTLREYLLEQWLPTVRSSLRPSTWESYSSVVERHVLPALGATPLQSLTAGQLDLLYAQLLQSGHHRGQGLAPKTVRYVHTMLHKALKDAERKQLVPRKVAQSADAPKLRQVGQRDMKTWTANELRGFLEGMAEHRLHAAFVLAAMTGMRRGEVLGLRWRDIDFRNARLAVQQTLLSVNYELQFGSPKTQRGRRSISMDPATVAALQAHRERQHGEQKLVGSSYRSYDLVFAKPDGDPVHPDYFSQCFDRSVARLGLPRIRLHDLRHTHATLGLAAGVPAKVISDRLGHATVAFTQDVYIHAIPELDVGAAERVADLVFGAYQRRAGGSAPS